ncbi:conserved hypothetical protein [Trichinella spiralis]|uniref:hypothetical protein n=1 Tax=Trichinella spiralis TaxID=6334 RepID=UPI0001EFBA71|nr:conserved hypothetical protein [Trichinella spiralis]
MPNLPQTLCKPFGSPAACSRIPTQIVLADQLHQHVDQVQVGQLTVEHVVDDVYVTVRFDFVDIDHQSCLDATRTNRNLVVRELLHLAQVISIQPGEHADVRQLRQQEHNILCPVVALGKRLGKGDQQTNSGRRFRRRAQQYTFRTGATPGAQRRAHGHARTIATPSIFLFDCKMVQIDVQTETPEPLHCPNRPTVRRPDQEAERFPKCTFLH